MGVLVIDAGTSSLRVAEVSESGEILVRRSVPSHPDRPADGLAELDAQKLAASALEMAADVLGEMRSAGREAQAIGIANQRATTVLWDKSTGLPVGPALSWQDLRTLGDCLVLQAEGLRLAPNESATKLAWLLGQVASTTSGAGNSSTASTANTANTSRAADAANIPNAANTAATDHIAGTSPAAGIANLRFGTLDAWLVWQLTQGTCHVTDHTNAGLTGLMLPDGSAWDMAVAEHLGIPADVLPQIVPSVGVVGEATALPGSLPIAALLGDQQSSLAGLGCLTEGTGKATFGTGTAVDICLGDRRVEFERRGENGTFPIICRTEISLQIDDQSRDAQAKVRRDQAAQDEAHFPEADRDRAHQANAAQAGEKAAITWGVEALDLSAGTNVAWLGEQWGLFKNPADSEALAASCETTDGVVFVPALEGLGAPQWDFGARGTFLGITRGTEASHMARAVLEGVAYRGAELLKAAEADGKARLKSLRIDGGMSRNKVFAQALANAAERPIEIAKDPEATSLGAAYLAGYATGIWQSLEEIARLNQPAQIIDPTAPPDWNRWQAAITQSLRWEESLSEISF